MCLSQIVTVKIEGEDTCRTHSTVADAVCPKEKAHLSKEVSSNPLRKQGSEG